MFGNELGSATIESMIILPLIIILIFSMLFLLIETYEFSSRVLNYHQSLLRSSEPEAITNSFTIFGVTIHQAYTYKTVSIDSRLLQETIEFFIYLSETYMDSVKGYFNEKE